MPRPTPTLDYDDLPPEVRSAVEAMLEGREVVVRRGGRELGTLSLRSSTLEGTVLEGSRLRPPPMEVPEGVTVVATAIPMSDAARRRLSDEFGPDHIVLDFQRAPSTADVLLVHPVSRQLLGILRGQFPKARIIVAEVDDEELGVHLAGPLTELRDAGAVAYLPPRSLPSLVSGVQAVLAGQPFGELSAGTGSPAQPPLALENNDPPRPTTGALTTPDPHGPAEGGGT